MIFEMGVVDKPTRVRRDYSPQKNFLNYLSLYPLCFFCCYCYIKAVLFNYFLLLLRLYYVLSYLTIFVFGLFGCLLDDLNTNIFMLFCLCPLPAFFGILYPFIFYPFFQPLNASIGFCIMHHRKMTLCIGYSFGSWGNLGTHSEQIHSQLLHF